ncbi:MAG: transcriptional regulator [Alphaproteobacteria bacterium]|nr:transcriptional regulator [Alphaproteobacteria bacterium]
MSHPAIHFGPFRLDPDNRKLSRDGTPLELNARYFDALILLVNASGELVTKERFLHEVWRGVPVTDEALTQAIRTLRRTLGDSAAAPRFIQTVPKHGYRFIAEVKKSGGAVAGPPPQSPPPLPAPQYLGAARADFIHDTLAATGGAMLAGALVGLCYGAIGATHAQLGGGGGAISLLLVLMLVSVGCAGLAGAGIGAGLALSRFVRPPRWYWWVAGGALGGLALGAFANLLGGDAFRLLFGREVDGFAGATEGFILGGAVGLATFFAGHRSLRAVGMAALLGAGAGLAIAMLGGRMMAGSLDRLVAAFPSSQFQTAAISGAMREVGLGPVGPALTSVFEGAAFAAGIVWGLVGRNGGTATSSRQI